MRAKATCSASSADLGAHRDEGGFGRGGDPGEQGRQRQPATQRALGIAARLVGPFGLVDALELVGDVGHDPRGEDFDLGGVDRLAHFGRAGVAAPEFARHLGRIVLDHRPQAARAIGQVAVGVVQPQTPREVVIAARFLHYTCHPPSSRSESFVGPDWRKRVKVELAVGANLATGGFAT